MVMNWWLTSFSFHVNRPPHSWDIAISNSDLGQGHGCGQGAMSYSRPSIISTTSFSFHINQTNNSWDTPISKFDLETSKVKVMSEVKGQDHISFPIWNRCTSFLFHINWTNHSWDMAKIVFDLEKTHPKFLKKTCQNNSFQQNYSKIVSGNNFD